MESKGMGQKHAETESRETSLAIYLEEISRIKLLSAEEEQELAKRISKGDQDAWSELVNANLRLVVSIAKKYTDCILDLEDRIQAGNQGLMKAAKKFGLGQGRFSTYAAYWIKRDINRAIIKQNPIYIPEKMQQRIRSVEACSLRLRSQGKAADDREIARELNLSEAMVQGARRAPAQPLSLNMLMGENEDSCLEELTAAPQTIGGDLDARMEEAVEKALCGLPAQQADVLRRNFGFYGDCMSLEQIGQIYGKSKESIRQMKKRALSSMKKPEYGYLRAYY